ncbi:MAG: DUF4338 domain-containing protein [Halopseudomonas sp.]
MQSLLRYRGRDVSAQDIQFIQQLIHEHPTASRRHLSALLCQAWDWVQPNGQLRDMVCRGLMLALHRQGHITLPPIRFKTLNPLAHRSKPAHAEVDRSPVTGRLSTLRPLRFVQVRRTPQEALFNSLIETHHYLGYSQPVGEHLKYIVYAHQRPIACLAWSSAPRHIGPRDRYIGWSMQNRRRNIHLIAYNTRFLILPWVQVRHLASHILGQMVRVLSDDWQRLYDHPVYYAETFVDPTLFRGTCYYAANWIKLGQTTGRGKNDQTFVANRSLKDVLGYPLTTQFRQLLGGGD